MSFFIFTKEKATFVKGCPNATCLNISFNKERSKKIKRSMDCMNVEKDVVLEEIKKGLNWRERIVVHIYKKTFVKIYKKGIEKGFNSTL